MEDILQKLEEYEQVSGSDDAFAAIFDEAVETGAFKEKGGYKLAVEFMKNSNIIPVGVINTSNLKFSEQIGEKGETFCGQPMMDFLPEDIEFEDFGHVLARWGFCSKFNPEVVIDRVKQITLAIENAKDFTNLLSCFSFSNVLEKNPTFMEITKQGAEKFCHPQVKSKVLSIVKTEMDPLTEAVLLEHLYLGNKLEIIETIVENYKESEFNLRIFSLLESRSVFRDPGYLEIAKNLITVIPAEQLQSRNANYFFGDILYNPEYEEVTDILLPKLTDEQVKEITPTINALKRSRARKDEPAVA